MTQVLLYVQRGDSILDYGFYTRELSRMCFQQEETLTLIRDKSTGYKHMCLIEVERCFKDTFVKSDVSDNENQEQFTLSFSLVIPMKKVTFKIDAHVSSCTKCELKRSRKFRRRFLKYVAKTVGFSPFTIPDSTNTELFNSVLWIPYVVEIEPLYPKQKIDFAW